MSKKMLVVKVNTKTRNAVLINIDAKPDAVMKIVGERMLAGKDLPGTGDREGTILRLVCKTAPADDDVRWTFDGNGFVSLGGWIRGDAVFVGYDPVRAAAGQPGVVSVPVDGKFILDRIRWFDPAVDSIGPADEEQHGAQVEGEPGEEGTAESA